MRKKLTEEEVNHLFDSWFNNNFDRVQVDKRTGEAVIVKVREKHKPSVQELRAATLGRNAKRSISRTTLFREFADRIWDMELPSGILLRDATGADVANAGGWYSGLAKLVKPLQRVEAMVSTRELFDLQRANTWKRP